MCKNSEESATKKTKKTEFFSAKELKSCIKAAQAGNQNAIDKLCEAFTPLIKNETYRPSVRNALGEDAEGIAWEAFLSYVHNYSGNQFLSFPGLVKVYVHYKLLHAIHQEWSLQDCEALDATFEGLEIVDAHDNIRACESRLVLDVVLKTLNEKHCNLLKEVYFNNKSLKDYAEEHHLYIQNCITFRNRAFKRARRLFSDLVHDTTL